MCRTGEKNGRPKQLCSLACDGSLHHSIFIQAVRLYTANGASPHRLSSPIAGLSETPKQRSTSRWSEKFTATTRDGAGTGRSQPHSDSPPTELVMLLSRVRGSAQKSLSLLPATITLLIYSATHQVSTAVRLHR